MELAEHLLPREFCRGPQWASEASRARWEPMLQAAQAAWSELELVSVTERLRDSALVHLEPHELPSASRDCRGVWLEPSVLGFQPDGSFRVAIHRPGLARSWYDAWAASDHDMIGRLLGFPDCCRAFFAEHWLRREARDVTPSLRSIDGPWEANPLLRWLGVRLVPHLPCSADCEATLRIARAYLAVGRRAGVDVAPIEALLKMRVEYDAANGLAVVSTDDFRFQVTAEPEAFTAKRDGGSTPEPTPWEDNGFSSREDMDWAHRTVQRGVFGRMGPCANEAEHPQGVCSALDLGAGDGELLAKIMQAAGMSSGRFLGIEADAGRAARGRARGRDVVCGRIQDVSFDAFALAPFDVVLLMPGRLLEMSPAEADRVRASLPLIGRRLVFYAYGDWLTKYGGLAGLVRAVGLDVVSAIHGAAGVEAAEGRVAA